MIEEVRSQAKSLEPYRAMVGDAIVDETLHLAAQLRDVRFAHLNSTARGGGVAEILRSMTSLMQGLGLDARWYVMGPKENPAFFQTTKRIHNMLQGMEGELSAEEKSAYLETSVEMASALDGQQPFDVWFLHDPQLLPLMYSSNCASPKTAFWVCHIDMSNPNNGLLEQLRPFMQRYDGLVFSSPSYVPTNVNGTPVHIIPPAIDPLTPKNVSMQIGEARRIVGEMGVDVSRPIIAQVSRFDVWKDPKGVIDAFRMARESIPGLQLILSGIIEAQDDPEAQQVLQEVRNHANGDRDIHLLWDPTGLPDTIDRIVNALQTASDVVLQKSIREGFGLAVTEAMWKGAAVIGGNAGGIRLQIQDGVNGYLVDTPEACACYVVQLVQDRMLREAIGAAARESVRENFLLPRILRDYLKLAHQRVVG